MIRYLDSAEGIHASDLQGFFVDWPSAPSPDRHLELLRNSDEVMLAVDDETGTVVGFVTAITDGVLAAYVPLLEVLPEHHGRGIGRELMTRILARLGDYYMVDLVCEPDLQPFYERLGMRPAFGMITRNYGAQGGREPEVGT